MKIAFIQEAGMSKVNQRRLQQINEVIDDYASQGYKLTLRQLYYQLVTKNIVPNNDKEYAKLGNLLTKGRMLGIVDWDAIEDRVRTPRHTYSVDGIEDAINDAYRTYRLDRMKDQENYIELWVEKDALSSVLSRKTQHYHVRLMVNRGYSSTTAMFDAYNRFVEVMSEGKQVNILYLGDHDPSGLDMVRDIRMRILRMLVAQPAGIRTWFEENVTEDLQDELSVLRYDYLGQYPEDEYELIKEDDEVDDLLNFYIYSKFIIKHIGLTSEQVRQYNPPPNPAKLKDPRSKWYIENFGHTSWEVDALNPVTLHSIIDTEVLALINEGDFKAKLQQEIDDKVILRDLPRVRIEHGKLLAENDSLNTKIEDYSAKIEDVREIVRKLNFEGKKVQVAEVFGEKLTKIKSIVNED